MFQYRKVLLTLPLITLILLIYGSLNCEVYAKSSSNSIHFEDLTVEFINESYVDVETFDISIEYRPDGKNALSFHADLTQDTPTDMRLKCTASARVFGNYVPTGLSVDGEVCQNFGPMKEYIDRLLEPLGFHCPVKMGSYHRDSYVPDLAGLPINLISGTHLLFDILLYRPGGIEVLIMKAYIVL